MKLTILLPGTLLLLTPFFILTMMPYSIGIIMNRYNPGTKITSISETVWRKAARDHADRIYSLLEPGLLVVESTEKQKSSRKNRYKLDIWSGTCIDTTHPVYNFLVEYYGIKGSKGVRRLSRWSPPLSDSNEVHKLEGVVDDDVCGGILHLRGASFIDNGVHYDPKLCEALLDKKNEEKGFSRTTSPFLWYRSILENTQANEPVLHCHGLHEWAMLYRPQGAPQPPSTRYQSHLRLRVDQETINAAVERRGVSCTHVDALRFFAKDALPLNRELLAREDQVRVEQPGCVHAHMDLLKIALRITPWIDATLIADALEVALEARKLDISASPYDVSGYGLKPVNIENGEGRKEYRRRQVEIMKKSEPVRRKLLKCYDMFIFKAFGIETVAKLT